jgi:LPXTG-site transpeptidase (sortase) family protein
MIKVLKNKKIQIISAATLVVLVVFLVAIILLPKPVTPKLTNKDGVIIHSTSTPDEEKPGPNFKWQGKPNDPKQIIIPGIGVEAFVQKVGVDQNNEVAVPSNLHTVGWFVDTVRPGEKGLSLIDGHVTGRQNDGVFKDLNKLKRGDKFKVLLGGGKAVNYEVISSKSAKTKESLSIMFSQNPKITSQLNLVTCSGKYDKKTKTYDERLTVSAKQL